ncbi:MAG: hypothetical protein K0R65_351 [Crocinitomicaceae bacterium]|jgi:hypothetical protein|nr:hypothetical protein [Crocinitomicaceae bacterium]
MILYNVTLSIDPDIHEDWLRWMRGEHIPEVLATNCFTEARLSRVNGEEEGGMTFSVMYFSPSEEKYEEYKSKFAPGLQRKHTEKYAGHFAAFRTVLTVIEEFK